MDIVYKIISSTWTLWLSAAPYIMLGLSIAGLMHAFIRKERIAKHLGARSLSSIIKSALFGIPLPLCSCGVLPAAVSLHKDGASKPATLAFLISTPESGVDSITVTYGLLGPIMAIVRPVAAFITAVCAGIAELFFGKAHHATKPHHCCKSSETSSQPASSLAVRLREGLHYAFGKLLRDITPGLVLGIVLGGLFGALVPESFIENYLGSDFMAKLVMLFVGIPIYICASASTPIAAAMMLKGMSPGTALVFLLAGPATNLTSLPVLAKQLGWRSIGIYLASIAICSMACGLALDFILAPDAITTRLAPHQHGSSVSLSLVVTIGLSLWMLVSTLRQRYART